MSQAIFKPEHLDAWVQDLPPGPPPPPPAIDALAALRQRSHPSAAVADPLAIPGGEAAEQARRDRETQERQQLKLRLAVAKLHGGLIVAALGQEPRDRDGAPPAAAVSGYVDRAARWIEETTETLARQWPTTEEQPGLSNYHRYEIARTLVAALERRPALLDEIAPLLMGRWLAATPPALPAEPASAGAWRAAGGEIDERMAWARALARVTDAALQAPFNRELPVLLDDARQAIRAEMERQIQSLGAGRTLPAEVARIVRMHALKSASQLYAATLLQVYRESARMIQRYQDLTNQGRDAEADRCALAYQERRLGYAGVSHHYRENAALHERWLAAATAAAPDDSPTAPVADPSRPVVPTGSPPEPRQRSTPVG